ncbi:rab-like protein 2B isoform X2 [Arvicola amphibius]|uniref:rab-like protein 2B isoform X2 n=1 Tax=Arvicola amphibius TaxID=1047088 RepID=UPI0018E36C22|nr:rab-like protein 2B isoform X2 [Arvicola amphibius]
MSSYTTSAHTPLPMHACFCIETCMEMPGACGGSLPSNPPASLGRQSCVHVADFWDTAGQERFQSMHASYYHKAHACIMVFDVQRKITYKNLGTWYAELREFRPEIPCILVANKIDADIQMTQKNFSFAKKFSLPLYFVSAADGTNVVKLFNDAIRLAVAYKESSQDFMDEVLQELENFKLEQKEEDAADREQSDVIKSPSPP